MDTNMNTAPLGSIENPHPYKWGQKDRIKGHCYLNKSGELRYWNGKRLKNGNNSKEYYENNKEKIKKNNKKYRENNKEKLESKKKIYRQENKKKINAYANQYWKNLSPEKKARKKKKKKEWEENNREKRKKYNNKWCKNKRQTDPLWAIHQNLRTQIRIVLTKNNVEKNEKSMTYCGCTVSEFYRHLEKQFTDGMNWDNRGRPKNEDCGWDIEHRRPLASFDWDNPESIFMAFHYTNLQPMWHYDNLIKGAYYDPETFPYKWVDREIGWIKK